MSVLSAGAADYLWNAGSGDWGTAANWSPQGVPGAGDRVTIANGGSVNLGAMTSLQALTLGGASSGTLLLQHTLAVTRVVVAANGTFRLDGSLRPVTLSLTAGGAVSNDGSLEVVDAVNPVAVVGGVGATLSGGLISFSGKPLLLGGVSVPNWTVHSGEILTLTGPVAFAGLTVEGGGRVVQTGSYDVIDTGVFNVAANSFLKGGGTLWMVGRAPQTVISGGNALGPVKVTGAGTIVSFADTVTVDGLSAKSGTSVVQASGVWLTVKGALALEEGAAFSKDDAGLGGFVAAPGQEVTWAAPSQDLGHVRVAGAGSAVVWDGFVTCGNFLMAAGTQAALTVNATLKVMGHLTLAAGGWTAQASQGSCLLFAGRTTQWVDGQSNRLGAVRVTGSGTVARVATLVSAGPLDVESGARWDMGFGVGLTLTGSLRLAAGGWARDSSDAAPVSCHSATPFTLSLGGNALGTVVLTGASTDVTGTGVGAIVHLTIKGSATWREGRGLSLTLTGQLDATQGIYAAEASHASTLVVAGGLRQTLAIGADDQFGCVEVRGAGTTLVPTSTWNLHWLTIGAGSTVVLNAQTVPVGLGLGAGGGIVNDGELLVENDVQGVTMFSSNYSTLTGRGPQWSGKRVHVLGMMMACGLTLESGTRIDADGDWGVASLTVLTGAAVTQAVGSVFSARGDVRFAPGTWEGARDLVCEGGATQWFQSGGHTLSRLHLREPGTLVALSGDPLFCATLTVDRGKLVHSTGLPIRVTARLSLVAGGFDPEVNGAAGLTLEGAALSLWAAENALGRVTVTSGTTLWTQNGVSFAGLTVQTGAKLFQGVGVTLRLTGDAAFPDGGFIAEEGKTGWWVVEGGRAQHLAYGNNPLGNVQWRVAGTRVTLSGAVDLSQGWVGVGVTLVIDRTSSPFLWTVGSGGTLSNEGVVYVLAGPFPLTYAGTGSTWVGSLMAAGTGVIRLEGGTFQPAWALEAGATLIAAGGVRLGGVHTAAGGCFSLSAGSRLTLTGSWIGPAASMKGTETATVFCESSAGMTLDVPGLSVEEIGVTGQAVVTQIQALNVKRLRVSDQAAWQMTAAGTCAVSEEFAVRAGGWRASTQGGDEVTAAGAVVSLKAAGNYLGRVRVRGGTAEILEDVWTSDVVVEATGVWRAVVPGLQILVEPSAVWTIDGMVSLTGTSGAPVRWESRSFGSYWRLAARADQVWVAYVRFRDTDASVRGEILRATAGGVDGGHNVSILFDDVAPAALTQLTAVSGAGEGDIAMSWISPGDDGVTGRAAAYLVKWSTQPIVDEAGLAAASLYAQAWTPLEAGQQESVTLTGWTPNVRFYLSVQAVDEAGNLAPFSLTAVVSAVSQKDVTPPGRIADVAAAPGIKAGTIELRWTATGDDGESGRASGYVVKVATRSDMEGAVVYAQTWTPQAAGLQESVVLTGGVPGVRYFVTVQAGDEVNPPNLSEPSIPAEVLTRVDTLAPGAPTGMMLVGSRLSWGAPRFNQDGSVLDDLGEYRVYRGTSSSGPFTLVASLGSGSAREYDIPSDQAEGYFTVRAVDQSGNESANTSVVRGLPGSWWSWRSEESNAEIRWPDSVALFLTPAGNPTGQALQVRVTKTAGPPARVLEDFRVDLVTEAGGSVGIHAFPASVEVSVGLTRAGAPASAQRQATAYGASDWAAFWFDGVQWIKIGGAVITGEGRVSFHVTQAGQYRVAASRRATGFVLTQVTPRKVFTPNGDGQFDVFRILYENPEDKVLAMAKIFDVRGAEIAEFTRGDFDNSLTWDGKDRSGQIVAGGVYLYQIEVDGRVYHGSVVVAK